MKDHFLYPLFCKLRPEEAKLADQFALAPFIEFILTIYLAPFALIGLIWLIMCLTGLILAVPSIFVTSLIMGGIGIIVAILMMRVRPSTEQEVVA